MRGYAKLVPVNASGAAIPVQVAHEQPAPTTVRLAPGAAATLTIRVSHVSCAHPKSADALKVGLPGSNTLTKVPVHDVTVCANGALHERALQPQK